MGNKIKVKKLLKGLKEVLKEEKKNGSKITIEMEAQVDGFMLYDEPWVHTIPVKRTITIKFQ